MAAAAAAAVVVVVAAVADMTATAVAVAVVDAVAVATSTDALTSLATSIGEAWVHELVRSLHATDRDVVGAGPGTMREARMRVVAGVQAHGAPARAERIDSSVLDDLARVANLAARRGWAEVTQPDPEP